MNNIKLKQGFLVACYFGKAEGKVVRIDKERGLYPILCQFETDAYFSFTPNGTYIYNINDQVLSFLPDQLSMPFDEVTIYKPNTKK